MATGHPATGDFADRSAWFRQPRNTDALEFGESILRGIGQVVFQNNWLTGAVILAAIFYNSWVYGIACLVGTAVSTLTAVALRADRSLIKEGLFGFNGALTAIGLAAYMSSDFTGGSFPGVHLWGFIVVGAIFSSVVFAALGAFLAPYRAPALTAPFVITGWLMIFGVGRLGNLEAGPQLAGSLPGIFHGSTDYSWTTWYQGAGKGVAEIFFQDNWVTGYLMVIGIAINSRVGAGMALGGSVLAAATAMLFGADQQSVRDGLYGFNAVLTAIAIGGVFYVLTARSVAYAAIGVVVTTWVWASVAVALAPTGMPTFTAPFVVVTWFMIMAKDGFGALIPVLPAETTTPEENRARWVAADRVPLPAAVSDNATAERETDVVS